MRRDTEIIEEGLEGPERAEPGRGCSRNGRQQPDQRDAQPGGRRRPVPFSHPASPRPSSAAVFAQLPAPANRKLARLGLLLAAAALSAGVACADGVVVQSTAKAYGKGGMVAEGQKLRLEPGERVVVLDQSGELITMDASGEYSAARSGKPPQQQKIDALRAAVWSQRRNDVGASRAGDLRACLDAVGKKPGLTEDDCREAFPQTNLQPTIAVENLTPGAATKGGAPLSLRITTNFDAAAACMIGTRQDPDAGYPLVLSGTGLWLLTTKDQPATSASKGDATLAAPTNGGDYKLTCRAVDVVVWRQLTAAAPAAAFNDLVDMLGSYAKIRGAPSAMAVIDLSVDGPKPKPPTPLSPDAIVSRQ